MSDLIDSLSEWGLLIKLTITDFFSLVVKENQTPGGTNQILCLFLLKVIFSSTSKLLEFFLPSINLKLTSP